MIDEITSALIENIDNFCSEELHGIEFRNYTETKYGVGVMFQETNRPIGTFDQLRP